MATSIIDFNALRPNAAMEAYQQGQQNQLAQMQLGQQQQAIRDAEAEREAGKAAGSDYGRLQQELFNRGLTKQGLAAGAAQAKQRADKIALLKDTTSLMKNTATQIMANPAIAKEALVAFGQQTGTDVSRDLAQLDSYAGNADAIKQWAAGHALEAEKLLPKFETRNLGATTERQGYNPISGAAIGPATVYKNTLSPDAAAADARARDRLAAESATGALTPESLDVAANVYLQTGQLPTGLGKAAAGLRTQVMNRATEMSTGKAPADVAGGIVAAKQDVASRGKAVKDFSTGIQGRQVNAFNTAVDHLSTMDKLTDALSNGDVKAINSVGNIIARQTGQPAPTNFDAAKQIVTAEVIKAVVASGGGVTERQEAERNFAAANSPEQLKGIINTYKQLLGGQLKSLSLQYENTTGRKDFDNKLTSEAKTIVQQLRGDETASTSKGGLSAAEQAELDQLRSRFKK